MIVATSCLVFFGNVKKISLVSETANGIIVLYYSGFLIVWGIIDKIKNNSMIFEFSRSTIMLIKT